jgi:xanthine/uracil permease
MFIDLKTVKIGLVIAAAIFCLIGLVWNLNDFVVNLLAGIVGLSLGILIALSIVDKAVEELEDAQWIKIRDSTYKSTYNDLSLIAFLYP